MGPGSSLWERERERIEYGGRTFYVEELVVMSDRAHGSPKDEGAELHLGLNGVPLAHDDVHLPLGGAHLGRVVGEMAIATIGETRMEEMR